MRIDTAYEGALGDYFADNATDGPGYATTAGGCASTPTRLRGTGRSIAPGPPAGLDPAPSATYNVLQ
ncbi:hypothetical protein [Streptomyces sp. SAI-127]|uniref:hypothetical protein n=1 Tax=Streptomyces sp. SAI-127 TaxID=2940543 RepID=UPI00247389C6|nr:hypothetical protein [Streptomyces sp. SAI-127]MDH6492543.1 hypothetical protein [Streptomyces sp. SAI-127]